MVLADDGPGHPEAAGLRGVGSSDGRTARRGGGRLCGLPGSALPAGLPDCAWRDGVAAMTRARPSPSHAPRRYPGRWPMRSPMRLKPVRGDRGGIDRSAPSPWRRLADRRRIRKRPARRRSAIQGDSAGPRASSRAERQGRVRKSFGIAQEGMRVGRLAGIRRAVRAGRGPRGRGGEIGRISPLARADEQDGGPGTAAVSRRDAANMPTISSDSGSRAGRQPAAIPPARRPPAASRPSRSWARAR